MKNLGYIKVSKDLQNEDFFKDPIQAYVYFRLVLKANAIAKTIKGGTKLEIGQCVMGYDHLANELGLTTSKVRTAIKNLKEQDLIDTKAITRVGTVVTVINYVENHTFQEAKKVTKASVKKSVPFKSLEDRKQEFLNSFIPFKDLYSREMFENFRDYWLEKGEKDVKYRFEKEKAWDVGRRLKTWKRNNFNAPKEQKESITDKSIVSGLNKSAELYGL